MANKWWRQFFAENLLMSVCGHLLLLAVFVTSVAVFVERAKLVAPDRIQIIEIDLDNVVVSGDETKLYNVSVPEEKKPEPKKIEKKPEPKPVEQEPEKKEIDKTTLVEEEKKQPKEEKTEAEPEKKPEPAPKKRQVVRVNREVLSLDRTLSVSVVDALRVAMTRCWNIDTTRPDITDIRAVAHLTLRKNGTIADLWFESQARADSDPAFAYVLDTIKAAISVCQPFRMLPENQFDSWRKIQLTFYPTQGKVL
ncbi:MAG: hypothetical protein R8N24_03180 [Alphaproteobacteria bacterium]|nr:hypothetical protein [Alphaproteobacteria bacterium]